LRQLLASVRHRLSDEQLGDALNALGGLALFARATSEARGAYNDALAIRARLGDAEKLAFTRMNLAILDALLGDAEAALSGLLSALEATAPAPRSWTRAAILTNLGNAYYTHGDSGSALAPLESAARLFWELGDAEGSAGAAAGLVANAASVGDPAKIAVAYKLLYRALEALSESADGHLLGAMRHAADRLRDGGFVDYAQDVRRLRLRLKKLTAATQSVGTL
jgi:tetratricopeptide (TPR) repeat protein